MSPLGYTRAVITPNAMEFSRLVKAVLQRDVAPCVSPDPRIVEDLANSMGNITVLHKGAPDLISDGRVTEECVAGGSPRRCGGQGDVLAGSLATFLHWSTLAADCGDCGPQIVAAWAAARLTRACAEQVRVTVNSRQRGVVTIMFQAYSQCGRSSTTSDMITVLSQEFSRLYENETFL